LEKSLYSHEGQVLLGLLRDLRLAAGVHQAELAARLNIRQQDLSKIETGVRRIDVVEFRRWAHALGYEFGTVVAEFELRIDTSNARRGRAD
jgi:transcriptional regulator with XRE-family HTH domain